MIDQYANGFVTYWRLPYLITRLYLNVGGDQLIMYFVSGANV